MENGQTMSYMEVKERSKNEAQLYGAWIKCGSMTLETAHSMLTNPDKHKLNLFQIAGLAQAIACFQCIAE